MTDRKAITVAQLLSQKLPEHILRFAKPIPGLDTVNAVALEPWITIQEPNRTVELHIREEGHVELHVYIPGRKRDPREALFICDEGEFEDFTDALVEDFNSNVERLS